MLFLLSEKIAQTRSKANNGNVICFVIWSSKKGRTGDARASGRDEGRGFLR